MSYMTVYKALLEVFPQVDPRVLKAVAVEHKKDSDIAVLVVLNEIIPFLEEKSRSSSSGENNCLGTPPPISAVAAACSEDSIPMEAADSDEQEKGSSASLPNENDLLHDDCHADVHGGLASGGTAIAEIQENNIVGVLGQSSDAADGMIPVYDTEIEWSDEYLGRDPNIGGDKVLDEEKSCAQDKVSSPRSCYELVVEPNMLTVGPKIYEPDCSLNGESEKDTDAAINIEDHSSSSMLSSSSQIFSVELLERLEGIIDDARRNKKIISSAVESVISLMSKVALNEITVEPAKLEASVAARNLLTASEDLKKRSQLMKEANNVLAGEVYGDRAVLTTEVKELHLRLHSLSEEKERSLKILDEMRGALLSRVAAVEIEKKASEMEKLEKEELGRRSLAEQQLIMESLVQESMMLNQEVEENAELREYLGNRGQVIEMLQEEISVICQDVRLLKEKFDQRFPFSKSTSSISTSSSSSLESVTSETSSEVPGDQFEDSFEDLQELDVILATSEQQLSLEALVEDDKKVMATDQATMVLLNHQFEESFKHLQESDAIPTINMQQFSDGPMAADDKKVVATDQASKVLSHQFEEFEHLQKSDAIPVINKQQFSDEQMAVDDTKVMATDQANEVLSYQFEESFEYLQKSDVIPTINKQQFSDEQMAVDEKKEVLEDGWETI